MEAHGSQMKVHLIVKRASLLHLPLSLPSRASRLQLLSERRKFHRECQAASRRCRGRGKGQMVRTRYLLIQCMNADYLQLRKGDDPKLMPH